MMAIFVDAEGFVYRRVIGEDEIAVCPMLGGKGRVCIGPAGEQWFENVWCYSTVKAAIEAAEQWNGEGDPPDGWHRHPQTGRRRPDGDPAREYVLP